jgi:uncharacterized protein (TIGR00251 family)
MKITVRVKPNSRKNEVKKLEGNSYLVSVAAPATEGKANAKLIEVLAEYFEKPKRLITILRGEGSRIKVVEIL